MKEYPTDKIRNIALVGHSGSGKTALAEAALFVTGALTRMGKTEEGNTVSDFDAEEIRRTISINTALIPVEFEGFKINLVDTPGYADFGGELASALEAVEMGIVVVDVAAGVEVGTELAWQALDDAGLPRSVVINKMDRDNVHWRRVLAELRESFDARFVPIQIPIGKGEDFTGVFRAINSKASIGTEGEDGEISAEQDTEAHGLRDAIVEAAAESDDELLIKYLDGIELTDEEVRGGLVKGAKEGKYVPVFFTSATEGLGVRALLHSLEGASPSPLEAPPRTATSPTEGEVELTCDSNGPLVARVFKTLADPYVGKLQYVRVYSGALSADSRVENHNSEEEERIGPVYIIRGKEQMTVAHIQAGDIGAVAKLGHTTTFDILGDKGTPFTMPPARLPMPLYSVALTPASQADGAKMGPALHKLCEEDPTLHTEFEDATRELILSGMGDSHIDVAVRHMKDHFGVEVNTAVPRIPYRETITRTATHQYRHRKQTGGSGQFAEVHLRVEPRSAGEGFEYKSEVVGGNISHNYIPSVEKGIRQILDTGIVANCPVVDTLAVVYDGKEHPVDSKDIAFQIAGREAFRAAFKDAGPVLLEPVYDVSVIVPAAQMGDVLGDLNTRRGMVQGTEQLGTKAVVKAHVPLAEIQRYATDLRSMTQGRGYFTMEFAHYSRVPNQLAEEVIAAVTAANEED